MQVKIEITADSTDERAAHAVDAVAAALAGRTITPAGESSEMLLLEEMAAELQRTRMAHREALDKGSQLAKKKQDADSALELLQKDLSEASQKLADTKGELKKLHARHRERQQEITRLQTAAEKAATTSRETIEGLRLRVSQLEEQLKTALNEVDEWKSWAEEEGIEFEEVDGQ